MIKTIWQPVPKWNVPQKQLERALDEEKAKAVPMPTWLKEKIKRIGRVNE